MFGDEVVEFFAGLWADIEFLIDEQPESRINLKSGEPVLEFG
jgi:hypothetical protein